MTGWMLAAQVAIVANAPQVAAVCAPVEVTVAARAPGQVAPALSMPARNGWQLLRRRTSTRTERDPDGVLHAVAEGTFVIATPASGRIAPPGVVATLGGRTARAVAGAIDVRSDPAGDDEPRVLVQATLDDRRAGDGGDSVFVGQQVDYVVDVRLNAAARRRMRRNPTFFPPDMPAVLAYDVEPAAPVARTGPQCFESLTYRRALFPLFPGPAAIPPAALTYAIPLSSSFFSREESHELRTDSVRFVAVEPPRTGRPADFAGAVAASVTASATLAGTSARMGDPLVLTVRLAGRGNMKLLPRPALAVEWATTARGAERVQIDSSLGQVRGAKEFDWVLTPTRAGTATIPAVRYPYFDPDRAAYDAATTAPLVVEVGAADLAGADTALASRLAIRAILREPVPPPLTERPVFWLLLALSPLPATVRRARRAARRRTSHATAAERLELAVAGGEPLAARELRRLFLDAIRERIPSLAPATARLPLARQLRRAGVTEPTAASADALLERLDTLAFGGGGVAAAATAADARRLAGEVDAQAVRTRSGGAARHGLAAIVAISLVAGAVHAQRDGLTRAWEDGLRAYEGGQYTLARRQFARIAAREPRAADAWANLGTAAWGAGDTAHAVAGWQRALRLEPLDFESRDRLHGVRPDVGFAASGYVPPVPAGALAAAALGLWLAAWLALAVPVPRRPRVARPVAGGAIALSVVLLAAALELRDRLDPRGLGVVRRSVALAEAPLPGAAAAAEAGAGEVAQVGAREGGWVRIVLDDTRAGWVPVRELLPLDDAASD